MSASADTPITLTVDTVAASGTYKALYRWIEVCENMSLPRMKDLYADIHEGNYAGLTRDMLRERAADMPRTVLNMVVADAFGPAWDQEGIDSI